MGPTTLDLTLYAAITIATLSIVLLFGDALYVGIWYYLAVLMVAALVC